MSESPKSNTWVVVVPTVLWFGLASAYVSWWQSPTDYRYDFLIASGMGIPFIFTGIAQLRSRFIWQNLRPGNRGPHQIDRPKMFILSTALAFVFGFGIVLSLVYLFAIGR